MVCRKVIEHLLQFLRETLFFFWVITSILCYCKCVRDKVSHQHVLSVICEILSLTDRYTSLTHQKNSLTNHQFSFSSSVYYTHKHTKQADMWILMTKVVTQNKCLVIRHGTPAVTNSGATQGIISDHEPKYDWLSVRYNVTLTPNCREIDWVAKSVYTTQVSCRSSIYPWNPSAAVFWIKESRRKVPFFELLEYASPKIRCPIPTQLQPWQI